MVPGGLSAGPGRVVGGPPGGPQVGCRRAVGGLSVGPPVGRRQPPVHCQWTGRGGAKTRLEWGRPDAWKHVPEGRPGGGTVFIGKNTTRLQGRSQGRPDPPADNPPTTHRQPTDNPPTIQRIFGDLDTLWWPWEDNATVQRAGKLAASMTLLQAACRQLAPGEDRGILLQKVSASLINRGGAQMRPHECIQSVVQDLQALSYGPPANKSTTNT